VSVGAWLELLTSGLITGGIYALVALGLNLQYGLMRILNIAHGEFLMLGAFATWFAQTQFGISPLLMVPVTFALLMGLGLLIHRLVFRRLTRGSANVDVFEARGLMVSFGLMFLVQNFASMVWGGYPYVVDAVGSPGSMNLSLKITGQLGTLLLLGAIANAMEQATGIRFTELPMSPPKVLKALRERGIAKG